MNKAKLSTSMIFVMCFSLVIVFFFCNRMTLGADTTDESFYVVMAYRLAQGNYLFSDMWEQVSTSSVLGGVLLWLYKNILGGGVEGCILFSRVAFFIINIVATCLLYRAESRIVKKEYAILLSLLYLIYAPFHIYTFGYNNLSNMFFLAAISFYLLAYLGKKEKYFLVAGVFCAVLAFTYPTMIMLCLIMFILIYFRRKEFGRKSWLYFCLGGFAAAAIISIVLLSIVGIHGLLSGIQGILSDPAYSVSGIRWSQKLQMAIEYFFYPFTKEGLYIKLFTVWLFVLAFWMKKYQWLKLTVALYPMVVLLETLPLGSVGTYGTGNFMFFMSFIAPWLIGFIEKNRKIVLNIFYIQWLPSIFFYLIIGSSSYGGAGQGSQCLYLAAIVTLTEIVFILEETLEIYKGWGINYSKLIIIGVLSFTVTFELIVYYSVVYRDSNWRNLTNEVTVGPYKGIRTTEAKKEYLEEMYYVMKNLEEKDKTVCVLYHSNFAYLYLDMVPQSPTAWGLYPSLDNQDVFMKYFSEDEKRIPNIIYVVNVDNDVDFDYQNEEYYIYAEKLNTYLSTNYVLVDERPVRKTGNVKKYVLKM